VSVPRRLLGFGAVLAVALGAGYGLGTLVGPTGNVTVETPVDMPTDHT